MIRNRGEFLKVLRETARETEAYLASVNEPHPFISRFFNTINWSPGDLKRLISCRASRSIEDIASENAFATRFYDSRIDKFCHKIWLTSVDDPHMPPDDYLQAYMAMVLGHPDEWTQLFWTNSTHVAEYVASFATHVGAKIMVAHVDSIPLGTAGHNFRLLISARKYVLAADVLKFIVLHRLGGIYTDLGICFTEDALQVTSSMDATFFVAYNLFFQTSWVSAARGSILTATFLAILSYPEILSSDYALDESKTVSAGTEVHTFAGLGYTACVLLFMPKFERMFVFAQNSKHIHWQSQQSWYGDKPKHGNVLISESSPTVIVGTEKYESFAAEAGLRVQTFHLTPKLREMAKIIANSAEYFESNNMHLSALLRYNGSDSLSGWHNYGYVYSFLFALYCGYGCTLLEFGDKASLWGRTLDSETEPPFGGSIRVWRQYLGARAFGAEIDRSAAHEFTLDQEILVNGSQRVTVAGLLNQRHYDVVIDNGYHVFEPSIRLLNAALPSLVPSGFYAIEAVPVTDLPRWCDHLSALRNPSLIIRLPHPINQNDNCLGIIFGSQ